MRMLPTEPSDRGSTATAVLHPMLIYERRFYLYLFYTSGGNKRTVAPSAARSERGCDSTGQTRTKTAQDATRDLKIHFCIGTVTLTVRVY